MGIASDRIVGRIWGLLLLSSKEHDVGIDRATAGHGLSPGQDNAT
jgi:hypothetical protein